MASTNASKVMVLMEKPITYINISAPISATGIVTNGMMLARQSRRNRKITRPTSAIASRMVMKTRSMDSSTKSDESNPMLTSMPSGSTSFSFSISARTPRETYSGLAVDCFTRPKPMAFLPVNRDSLRSSAGPISTAATSPRRTR